MIVLCEPPGEKVWLLYGDPVNVHALWAAQCLQPTCALSGSCLCQRPFPWHFLLVQETHLHLSQELLSHQWTSWYQHPYYPPLLTEEETKCRHTFWVAEPKKDACSLMHMKLLFLREWRYTVPVSSFWTIFSHQMKLRMKILYMYVHVFFW